MDTMLGGQSACLTIASAGHSATTLRGTRVTPYFQLRAYEA
jgi:hypothetical protein